MAGMKLFAMSQAIWNDLAPSREVWILLPNALISGTLPQKSDITEKLNALREEKGIKEVQDQDTSADEWTVNQYMVPEFPEALEDVCITLINGVLLYDNDPIKLEIFYIDPRKIIAWGPGRLSDDPSSSVSTSMQSVDPQ